MYNYKEIANYCEKVLKMKYKISKELFENVMNCKVSYIQIHSKHITYQYITDDLCESTIPIDTFFFKCKNFIASKGFGVSSGMGVYKNSTIDYSCSLYMDRTGKCSKYFTDDNSEQQAVFDATQFILEQGNK